MLRGELGDSRFWRAVAHYVRQNAQRNVETIDFIRAIEESTGRNLRGFFNQWVFREGHPSLEVRVNWDAPRKVATLTVDQKQSVDAEHPPYEFDVDVVLEGENAERRIRARIERQHETVTVPLDFELRRVRFDPGAFILADVTYAMGVDFAAALLRSDADIVARIRAARELANTGGRIAQEAIAEAFERDPFWGVLAETAAAIGATRAPWARTVLMGALSHPHPKVVRAVAAALGNFRDADVATAVITSAQTQRSYFVRAAALTALGKTRDPRAFDVLAEAVKGQTWNGVVESGAVAGLAELADARAVAVVIDACRPERNEGLRRAAVTALARIGALLENERTRVVEAIEQYLDDRSFLVAMDAIAAAETLGDQRFLPVLDRLAQQAFDGRMRRDAAEAAARIRRSAKVPTQVTALRDDINELREEQRKLQEKIEALART
jgi:aminopeptidase N